MVDRDILNVPFIDPVLKGVSLRTGAHHSELSAQEEHGHGQLPRTPSGRAALDSGNGQTHLRTGNEYPGSSKSGSRSARQNLLTL